MEKETKKSTKEIKAKIKALTEELLKRPEKYQERIKAEIKALTEELLKKQEKHREKQARERQRNKEINRAEKRNPTENMLRKHKDIKISLELAEAQTVKSGKATIKRIKERIDELEGMGRITESEAITLQEITQKKLMRIYTREHQEKSGLRKPRTEDPQPPSYKQKIKKEQ